MFSLSVSVVHLVAEIEVYENGTLDLSMKKNRIHDKSIPPTSSPTTITTPSSSPFNASSLLVNAAFYQALSDQEGWNVPINYSKSHGKTEEEKEVLCQFCHRDFHLTKFSFTFLSLQKVLCLALDFHFIFMCMSDLPPFISVYLMHAWCLLWTSEEGVTSHATGVIDDHEPLYEGCKLNPGPLHKQQKSFPQPLCLAFDHDKIVLLNFRWTFQVICLD